MSKLEQQKSKDFYHDADGKPLLKESYCAFLDVLGFRDKIRTEEERGNLDLLFYEFRECLLEAKPQLDFGRIDKVRGGYKQENWALNFFTDNVAIGLPVDSMDSIEFLIMNISAYQLSFASKGFFLRGGVSKGKHFQDDKMVFGPAIIEAYNIESKKSVNPRIVISPEVFEDLPDHLSFNTGINPKKDFVNLDTDGNYYINYLYDSIQEGYTPPIYWVRLDEHKEQIIIALEKFKGDFSKFTKYQWLADYHNRFCNRYSDYPGFNKDYLIKDELIHNNPIN